MSSRPSASTSSVPTSHPPSPRLSHAVSPAECWQPARPGLSSGRSDEPRSPSTQPPQSPPDSAFTSSPSSSPSSTTSPPATATKIKPRTIHTPTINGLCGAIAGITSGIVTCPLDVIKTRLQNQRSFRNANAATSLSRLDVGTLPIHHRPEQVQYRGMVGSARVIFRDEGVRGFYRGLGPLLLGYLPTWAVYMGIYDTSRDYYNAYTGDNRWLPRIYASITAGACSTLATNPIWVIKTRLMSQGVNVQASSSLYYHSAWDAAKKMYRIEGVRSFYSGLVPALFGLTHVAIQFPLYEYYKLRITGLEMGESPAEGDSSHYLGIMAATFLSKVCATSATYPHEVVRTRLQNNRIVAWPDIDPAGTQAGGTTVRRTQYPSAVATVKTMYQHEGWRAFYAGMGTNMFRAIPAAMTTMLTYEFVKTTLQKV